MSMIIRSLLATFALALVSLSVSADPLDDVKARRALEAQRVEKDFTDGRAEAYRLVRAATPNYVDAYVKLRSLQTMLESDSALSLTRRQQLIVTIKADLDRVKIIADEKRRTAATEELTRSIKSDVRRDITEKRGTEAKRTTSEADRLIAGRGTAVADSRTRGKDFNERYLALQDSVAKSAMPVAGDISFPANWRDLSMKRLKSSNVTAKEQAILKALNTVIDVEYTEHTLQQVIDHLEKLTGMTISIDKASMDEAGVKYDTPINLKHKATLRSVLRKLCGDLNLAYVVRNERIEIHTRERARSMTTVRTYYVGDLANVADVRLGPVLSQIAMIENLNNIMNLITQTVETDSWRVNNPDAVGTIVFDPRTMSLIVKQTAEVHYMLGGGR